MYKSRPVQSALADDPYALLHGDVEVRDTKAVLTILYIEFFNATFFFILLFKNKFPIYSFLFYIANFEPAGVIKLFKNYA